MTLGMVMVEVKPVWGLPVVTASGTVTLAEVDHVMLTPTGELTEHVRVAFSVKSKSVSPLMLVILGGAREEEE